jgi:hypothetical protein
MNEMRGKPSLYRNEEGKSIISSDKRSDPRPHMLATIEDHGDTNLIRHMHYCTNNRVVTQDSLKRLKLMVPRGIMQESRKRHTDKLFYLT